MDNCKIHNSKLTKGNWTRSGSFDGTIPHIPPKLHPWTFGFPGGAKRDERIGLLEQRGGQNILTLNVGKNGFRSTFQHIESMYEEV
jgi:hypothetical protein